MTEIFTAMQTVATPSWRVFTLAVVVTLASLASTLAAAEDAGIGFIPTEIFPAEEDAAILKAFEGLRVADVTDGMDAVGLPNVGLMDHEVAPLWKDTVDYKHRIIGIAVTARYVPTQRPWAGKLTTEEYDAWAGKWYNEISNEPFVPFLRAGSALVIEDAPKADVGSIGSNNIMAWMMKGCVGVITNATARDTDEIITQKIPIYLRHPARGIRPGRNEIESVNRPVVVGSVLVMPGDLIVADGDGVIVVPRAVALEVAGYAHKVIEADKAGRRNLYKELGLPEDASVR
jgi:4-hydroxy-4-methyl-2-oxoglutarate aldolase